MENEALLRLGQHLRIMLMDPNFRTEAFLGARSKVTRDLRITPPTGGVVLSTAQAIRLADELAYLADLRLSTERHERRVAVRARRH